MDAFIFCFVGEYLSTKVSMRCNAYRIMFNDENFFTLQSKMIGDAAYESLWYESKPNQNRDVFLMIVRSQKRLTLTVGKFVDLSLQQFANVRIYSANKIGYENIDIFLRVWDCVRVGSYYDWCFDNRVTFFSHVAWYSRMLAVIARMYHVVDRESISVICVGVTRDVLKTSACIAPFMASRAERYNTLLLPPAVYTINNFPIQRDSTGFHIKCTLVDEQECRLPKHRFSWQLYLTRST